MGLSHGKRPLSPEGMHDDDLQLRRQLDGRCWSREGSEAIEKHLVMLLLLLLRREASLGIAKGRVGCGVVSVIRRIEESLIQDTRH